MLNLKVRKDHTRFQFFIKTRGDQYQFITLKFISDEPSSEAIRGLSTISLVFLANLITELKVKGFVVSVMSEGVHFDKVIENFHKRRFL